MPVGNVKFIRTDVLGDRNTSLLSGQFASNNGGDALVVLFGGYTTGQDFPVPPQTMTDDAGNTYNLVVSIPDGSTNTPPTPAVYIYLTLNCAESGANVFSFPASVPGDLTFGFVAAYEFKINAGTLLFDAVTSDTFGPGGGMFTLTQHGQDDLVLGFATSSDAFATSMTYTTNNVTEPSLSASSWLGWQEASSTLGTSLARSSVTYSGAETAFAMMVGLSLSNATGGSAQGKATIRITKSPAPKPMEEGRAVATVQIDCTQMPVQSLPINYPELTTNATGTFQGFTFLEIDLEHVTQGSGLSEVRHVHAYSRPSYNGDDVNAGATRNYPAFLTNVATMQTYILGANAATIDGGSSNLEHQIFPMPCDKHSLKFRFIVPQDTFGAPVGKFTILFFNFPLDAATQEWFSIDSE